MPFVFLAILVGLSLSSPFRKLVIGLAVVLIAYIAWDNLVTETIVGPNAFEVQESNVVLFSEPSMDMAAQLKLQIANNSSFELESVDAVVTLDDCPTPLSSAWRARARREADGCDRRTRQKRPKLT